MERTDRSFPAGTFFSFRAVVLLRRLTSRAINVVSHGVVIRPPKKKKKEEEDPRRGPYLHAIKSLETRSRLIERHFICRPSLPTPARLLRARSASVSLVTLYSSIIIIIIVVVFLY